MRLAIVIVMFGLYAVGMAHMEEAGFTNPALFGFLGGVYGIALMMVIGN